MSDRQIIVGVDNSAGSHQALHWAADEAVRTGRQLIVTTAYDWHVAGARFQVGGAYADDIRRVAEGVVQQAVQDAASHAPGVNVVGETVIGSAGPVLADCQPDDLVVVGTRGRGGFASLVLGSVGHHVATQAKGTVVVVRGRTDAVSGPVVIGVDRGPGDSVLQQGFEEANARGTGVVVVHAFQLLIIPAAPTGGYPVTEDATARQSVEIQALHEVVDPWTAKYPDVAVDVLAIEGHPTEVLTHVSQRAQLVVVGHRATGLGHIGLGAVAAQLLHHADCPVMVTRSGAVRAA
jgi:nucleotide-binding universal stress UspA family protein